MSTFQRTYDIYGDDQHKILRAEFTNSEQTKMQIFYDHPMRKSAHAPVIVDGDEVNIESFTINSDKNVIHVIVNCNGESNNIHQECPLTALIKGSVNPGVENNSSVEVSEYLMIQEQNREDFNRNNVQHRSSGGGFCGTCG